VDLTNFERHHQTLAPRAVFVKRVMRSLAIGLALLGIALMVGIGGYHWIAGLDWIDSLLEASMILGGMGPINPLATTGSKLFASVYALFSGVIFIALMGIVLAPLAHRMLHRFHLDDDEAKKQAKRKTN
jgi:membrane protein YdbS with pleckstrin-like domain